MIQKQFGLVACCKTKLSQPANAEDLYIGHLFRLSVEYLKPRTDGWAILSARYGVVLPGTIIAPYEQTLVGAPRHQVDAWGENANSRLRTMFPGRRFIIIAGRDYLGAVAGLDFEQPFAGLSLGRKLQAIKASIA